MSFLPRQYIYIAIISILLSIFVLFFSFNVLIPTGKKYREQKEIVQTLRYKLNKYENIDNKTLKTFNTLSKKHHHLLFAFRTSFNLKQFIDNNRQYFQSLQLTKLNLNKKGRNFDTYKVDAISKIKTPSTFYTFLDNLDKQGWIIKINFPIHFKREGKFISLVFTMSVYHSKSFLKI